MALTVTQCKTYRNPDRGYGETRASNLAGEGEEQVCTGAGHLASVTGAVAGTLVTFYDAISGDTLNATNQLLKLDTSVVTGGPLFHGPPIAFRRGLRAVTTGAGTELTVGFAGGQNISATRYYP